MNWFNRGMVLLATYAVLFPVVTTLLINRAHWGKFLLWLVGEPGAGWFQAIGSVASILFSGWFVAEQIKAGRQLETERRELALRAELKRAFFACQATEKFCDLLTKRAAAKRRLPANSENVVRGRIEVSLNTLATVDRGVVSYEVTRLIYALEIDLTDLRFKLENFQKGSPGSDAQLAKACKEATEGTSKLKAIIPRFLED